jgi:hypothetical protein
MKMLFDFFPIIIFFAAYHLGGKDMVIATEAGIAATVLQVTIFWIKNRRFEKMHLITLALISVFGGITIALDDAFYIKWKTTILEWQTQPCQTYDGTCRECPRACLAQTQSCLGGLFYRDGLYQPVCFIQLR